MVYLCLNFTMTHYFLFKWLEQKSQNVGKGVGTYKKYLEMSQVKKKVLGVC